MMSHTAGVAGREGAGAVDMEKEEEVVCMAAMRMEKEGGVVYIVRRIQMFGEEGGGGCHVLGGGGGYREGEVGGARVAVVAQERKSRMWVMRHAEKLDDVDDTWANTAGKKKKLLQICRWVHFIFLKRHRLRAVELLLT
jgi:hypothetical protein